MEDSNFRRGTGHATPQYGFDHRGLKSLNIVLCSVHMLSSRMLGQQLYSTHCNTNESSIINIKTTHRYNTTKPQERHKIKCTEKYKTDRFYLPPSPPFFSPPPEVPCRAEDPRIYGSSCGPYGTNTGSLRSRRLM